MRAVMMREFGPPDVLVAEDVPEPVPAEGEVLIDVQYASITFVETQVRAGHPPHPSMLPALPVILGNGVGGLVTQSPPSGGIAAGAPAVSSLGGSGGYAERAVARVERLVEVPAGVSLPEAVALLADGRTALGLIRLAGVRSGETVLVEAAAGGVGTLLVQLARNAGARVVALAGGERKLNVVRALGADVSVDYLLDDWPRQVRKAVHSVDVVFDGVGGAIGLAALGLVGAGGRFCPFGMASGAFTAVSADLTAARGISVLRSGRPGPDQLLELTRAALREAQLGRLRPVIGQQFALGDAAAAHSEIEARAGIGKSLLTIGRPG